jgi:hypothetical protein
MKTPILRHRATFKCLVRRSLLILIALLCTSPISRAGTIFDEDYVSPSSKTARTSATQPATQPATASVPEPIKPPPDKPQVENAVVPKPNIEPIPPVAIRIPLSVPAPADQARSRKLFKEAFADELKDRSVPARRALAALLLAQADKIKDNPSDQFVLLIGARDAAAEGGDLRLAARAADLTARAYDVDALRLKTDAALKHPLRSDTPAATAENCRAAIELLDALIATDDYATAAHLLAAIQPAAVDPALNPAVQARARLLTALRTGQERVAAATEKLKRTPRDPAASHTIGSFLCFLKADWDHGLPLLAVSDQPTIKAAAVSDLATKNTPDQQVATGDAWWNAADKEGGALNAAAMRQRAAVWYSKALTGDQITGLARIRTEKRIATAAQLATPAAAADSKSTTISPPAAPTGDVTYLCDLKEVEKKIGHQQPLLKKGESSNGAKAILNGKYSPHSLATHAETKGVAYVVYDLEGRFTQFTTAVGINDAAKDPASPLVFRVIGDGVKLWESQPVSQKQTPIPTCTVDITGVKTLKLEVYCEGDSSADQAIWMEPQVR